MNSNIKPAKAAQKQNNQNNTGHTQKLAGHTHYISPPMDSSNGRKCL